MNGYMYVYPCLLLVARFYKYKINGTVLLKAQNKLEVCLLIENTKFFLYAKQQPWKTVFLEHRNLPV